MQKKGEKASRPFYSQAQTWPCCSHCSGAPPSTSPHKDIARRDVKSFMMQMCAPTLLGLTFLNMCVSVHLWVTAQEFGRRDYTSVVHNLQKLNIVSTTSHVKCIDKMTLLMHFLLMHFAIISSKAVIICKVMYCIVSLKLPIHDFNNTSVCWIGCISDILWYSMPWL